MRIISSIFLLLFSSFSFSTSYYDGQPDVPAGCVEKNFYAGSQSVSNGYATSCLTYSNLIQQWVWNNTSYRTACYQCSDPCPSPGVYDSVNKTCEQISSSSSSSSSSCGADQVFYEGICRDVVSTPSECGANYATAIQVGGGYACSSNGDCPNNFSAEIYTNANGSWNVCTPEGNSSSSVVSSQATSSAGSSATSSIDSGQGSSSGSGTSSANSSAGTGQGETGGGFGDASAADCNSDPQCDGDPVQCAILVQLWINNCQGYSQNSSIDPEADLAAMGDQFSSLIGQSSNLVAGNGVLNALAGQGNGNGSSGSGDGDGSGDGYGLDELDSIASQSGSGTCPQDRQINLRLGNFAISYQPICDLASQLSSLVLLIYGYVSMLIVYRAIANS